VKRSDIPLLALALRRAGELLVMDCRCDIEAHRWRYDTCTYRFIDTDDARTVFACVNGHMTRNGITLECPACWVTCTNGYYLANGGDYRPCPLCRPHNVTEHLWRSTTDMAPGLRAANTDPGGANRWVEEQGEVWPVPNDPSGDAAVDSIDHPDPHLHDTLLNFLDHAWDVRQLVDFLEQHRPDRHAPTKDPASDNEYCRHHLNTLGTCEPRYRGDLCRTCYDFELAHPGLHPTKRLLELKREGRRWTQQDVTDALKELKPAKGKKGRRKAS
jgi:hypothetical protein